MNGDDSATATATACIPSRADASTLLRWAEMLGLFFGLPGLLFLVRQHIEGLIIPLIMLCGLAGWLYLRRQPDFDTRRLWDGSLFLRRFARTLLLLVPLGTLAALMTYIYIPEAFMMFPRRVPVMWLVVMLLYPVLSAYPQELLYRALFFHRYRSLFRSDKAMILASALFFGWGHAFLGNWIAPLGAALGGLLFGFTFLRTRSLLQTSLEHGLWGDLLFTLGSGWFFYAGSISHAQF
jgi:membrane protease YdiL (CAAX protease family)